MHGELETLEFRLWQAPKVDRVPNTLVYSFDLTSPRITSDVMYLATRIVEADPEAHAVRLSFLDHPATPALLSHETFRSFAKILNQSLPTWPHLFCEQDGLQELLFLASLDNMRIVEFSEERIWVATVSAAEFNSRISALYEVLATRLPSAQSEECLASLTGRLKR